VGDGLALVADIGRQSVRFGITGGGAGLEPRDVRRFSSDDHPTFTSALVSYLRDCGLQNEHLPSALAVAGATRGDLINPTGSRWYISLSGIESVLRVRPLALNECVANALALVQLPASAYSALQGMPNKVEVGGNYVVLGAGAGLGVAALITSGNRLVPVPSEAGHMTFAACTADERRFVEYCAAKGLVPDTEMLLSEPGLLRAYEVLSGGAKLAKPEDVMRAAGRDPVAAAVVQMFVEHLGAYAGDLVLAYAAWDGVYLTGPLARALHSHIAGPGFHRRMVAKASFRRQLSEVPVSLVTRTDLELLGAAAALRNG
jgi:glucokinase